MPNVKEGNLQKKSPGWLQRWQLRAFSLDAQSLSYSSVSESKSKPHKRIDLTTITEVCAKAGAEFLISTTSGRTYELKAEDEDTACAWIAAVNEARVAAEDDAVARAKPLLSAASLLYQMSREQQEELSDSLGHELRGLNVEYLSSILLDEVFSVGLERNAKVYEIESPVIRAKGRDMIGPRDGRLGASYVDCVSQQQGANMATHMLSYTWGYAIGDITDGVVAFCENSRLSPSQTCFWICCFCVNQHRVKEAEAKGEVVSFESFQQRFGNCVRGVGHVVALMSPWTDPVYVHRVWCNFEMFTAVELGAAVCPVSVVMPPREAIDMRRVLIEEGNMDKLWDVLAHIDIENCDASVPQDKANILNLIRREYGFPDLNTAVAQCLKTWVTASCEAFLEMEWQRGDDASLSLARACKTVGKLLRYVGQVARAIELLEKGKEFYERIGTLQTFEGALLVREIGVAFHVYGNSEKEFAALEEARAIHERTGTLETTAGAKLLTNIGESRHKAMDFASAREAYGIAKGIRQITGTLETADGAALLVNIGELLRDTDNLDAALASFEVAMSIRVETGTMQSPDASMLFTSMGETHYLKGDMPAALRAYESAWLIRDRTGTLHLPEGRELVEKMKQTHEGADLLLRLQAM